MEDDNNFGETAKTPRRPSFYRLIKALSPVPYLIKARDYYIRSMTKCAGRTNYSGMVFGSPGPYMNLPKSFSTTSSRNEDEFRELLRAASQKSAVSRSKSTPEGGGVVMLKSEPVRGPPPPFRRSFSTSTKPMVGRIDEEKPCYFPASFRKSFIEDDVRFLRSRSCNGSKNSQAAQTRVAAYKK